MSASKSFTELRLTEDKSTNLPGCFEFGVVASVIFEVVEDGGGIIVDVIVGFAVVVIVVIFIVSSFSLTSVIFTLVTFKLTAPFELFATLFMLTTKLFFRNSRKLGNLGFDVAVVPSVILSAVIATVVMFL